MSIKWQVDKNLVYLYREIQERNRNKNKCLNGEYIKSDTIGRTLSDSVYMKCPDRQLHTDSSNLIVARGRQCEMTANGFIVLKKQWNAFY